jgi:RNase P protein component
MARARRAAAEGGEPRAQIGMREIARSKQMALYFHEGERLVVLIRQEAPWESSAEIVSVFQQLIHAVDKEVGPGARILVDSRSAMLRNDPEFEEVFGKCRQRFNTRFSKIAIIVKTAVGKLQAQRFAVSDGNAGRVFSDPAEALAYLNVPVGIVPAL